jgi:chromosome partitioning protein
MIPVVMTNQRGGVAKTTSTHSIADCFAAAGKKVLIIDTDPQGSIAVVLGVKPKANLHQLVVAGFSLSDCVTQVKDGIDLIASDRTTVETEVTLMARTGRELAFKMIYDDQSSDFDRYDIILIDVAPSITLLQTCSMLFAERLVIPVAMDLLSLQGAVAACSTARQLNKVFHTNIRPVAFLPVMVDARLQMTKLVLNQLTELSREWSVPIVHAIRNDVTVNKASKHRQFLADYDPDSRVAGDYKTASEQLLAILEEMAGAKTHSPDSAQAAALPA